MKEKKAEGGYSEIIKESFANGDSLAWKICKGETPEEKKMAIMMMNNEKNIHKKGLKHPCIVIAYPDVGDKTKMLMEWYHEGFTFLDYIQKYFNKMVYFGTRETKHDYVTNILLVTGAVTNALNYLQTIGIVAHRDLKSANILMEDKEGIINPREVKLADFGTALTIEEYFAGNTWEISTKGFRPPEIQAEGNSDVYSLGITIIDALSNLPNPEEGVWGMLPKQRHLYREFKIYKNLVNMLFDMTRPETTDRLNLNEVSKELDDLLLTHVKDR